MLSQIEITKLIARSSKFAGCLVGASFALQASAVSVDLLVLYDQASATYFNQQVDVAMQSWVAQINNAYRDSNVDIQLRLVGTVAHQQAGTDMSVVLGALRQDPTAIALRDQYGADLVSHLHDSAACGIGYFSINRNWTWNLVGPDCGALTMAHELGHNMGLAHSRRQGDTTGVRYAYGLGHGVDNLFGTIMTYSYLFTNRAGGRLAKFSNPDVDCLGVPCGVPEGQPDQANAALALNNVRNEVAAFRAALTSVSSSPSSAPVSSRAASSAPPSSSPPVTSVAASSRALSSTPSVVASSRPASSQARSSVSLSSPTTQTSSAAGNQSSLGSTQARCEYTVVRQSRRSFTGVIQITNTGAQPIQDWSVTWQYSPSTWLAAASGAIVYGRNPYTATASRNAAPINPGQSQTVTVYGYKERNSNAETPEVMGSLCR